MLQQALILHRNGQLDEASSLYRKILAHNPRDAHATHLLGVIELQTGNAAAALHLIDRAIEIDPVNITFHSNRAAALQDLKRFDDALASCDRALAIKHDSSEVLNNRGTVLRELKRFDEALVSYDAALTIKPDYVEALNNRGNALRDMQHFDDALVSYDRALAIRPDYADAWSNRGSLLQDLGRHDEALASFENAIVLRPSDAVAHRNRAVLLHLLKRNGDAIASYEKAIALKPDYAEACNKLGNVLAEEARLDEAIVQYERARAIKPDYVEAHINLANALRQKGDLDAAAARYRHVLAIAPRYVETYLGLGDLLVDQGKFDEALRLADAAMLLKDEASFSYFTLGVLFARCRRDEAARRCLLTYLQEDVEDRRGARLILAGLGGEPMPARASASHLRHLYASRADRWGGSDSAYKGHELVAGAVMTLCAGRAGLDILDAGCGTGLVGTKLRAMARRLDGVDLTPTMLERAKQSHSYDNLCQGDLVEFLTAHPAEYDVIASAATLIHFGDLRPVFAAAAASLRGGGFFVFTLLANDGENCPDIAVAPLGGLAEGGCYVHGRNYVARLAKDIGFSVALLQTDVHEYDTRGGPISGLIVALRRDAAI